MSWQHRIEQALDVQRSKGLWRQMQPVTTGPQGLLSDQHRQYIHFSSNDYLGLSRHPKIIEAWQRGLNRWGAGAGASGHVTGYTPAHQQLEQLLADWLGYGDALLFSSGFAANQALIFALTGQHDRILADKLMHASLLEAAALSPATLCRFRHNSPESLDRLLVRACEGETLIVTEGIFSMDGDSSPLAELRRLADQSSGWLVVDDAHGIGVTGAEGRGSCHQQRIMADIQIVTFGKALGVAGAAILCSKQVADYLRQTARHLIYSTAMPPAQADAICCAIALVRQGDELRDQLQQNIAFFRHQVSGLGWDLLPSDSAIQPLIIGDNHAALQLSAALRQRGFWINAIRPPTVPAGSARLRITLSAAHQKEQIEQLAEQLYALES
ncbi:8-amino-7-oxononanoate synthase [Tatumella citrea]|uniref:8-amino-7-oxononanoate synthase n=1 Tax=Tatumella citrea TaxID=53336 RepID=A0A1Y0LH96_TATCI|nr:8-amino-7-oxononanoate synthase [Tatumella citrea]ARU93443.1 8-amino-7-oxononanoate synthase [Tatumella citrea]ARU97482.1 8-amino-7-oxononanoate synthase [Tatumella citrea]